MLLRMRSRAVLLLAHEGDIGQLTGPEPYAVRHHVACRLLNILITREKMRLEIEQVKQEEITSGQTTFYLNPTV